MKSYKFINKLFILLFIMGKFNDGFTQEQNPVLNKLTAYNTLVANHHPEKMYIHTNQPFYNPGDTIWFKSYIIDSYENKPSIMSKMLNVELISNSGTVIYRTKLRTHAGLAWGNISLGDSIKDGTYHLRAYTPAMKKFGETFYYDRSVAIKHSLLRPSTPLTRDNSIQFFPEGGELLAGIRTKVAFKSIAPGGLGIDVSGSITNDAGELITEFKSEHLGMGVFAITAQEGRNYYANIRFKDGTELKELIPVAKNQGYMISVSNVSDSIRVRVLCSPQLKERSHLTLIGSQDGISKYLSQFNVNHETNNTVWISKALFNSGTVQFTLLDPAGKPVSERLIFVNKQDELLIQADLKRQYNKREAVNFVADLQNQAGITEFGSLSVSVYNESEYAGDDKDESSIFSELLLTADLIGFIESPNYYFSNLKDENRARHLDHLLLTQGWRKFSWKNTLSKNLPAITESDEEGLELAGKMTLPSGKPFAASDVSLFRAGLPPTVLQTTTDAAGRFKFSDLDFLDTVRFVISANNQNFRKNMKIELFNKEDAVISLSKFPAFTLSENKTIIPENVRLNDSKYRTSGILLNSVNIQARKINKVISSTNLNGPGRADAVFTADDIGNQHDLSVFLTNRVNGLKLHDGKIYARETPDKASSEQGPQPMLVVLDGMHIEQGNFDISSIHADGVESVEVLKGAATTGHYGIDGAYGVLVITTKKGTDRTGNVLSGRAPGILPFTLTGYQSSREFYSPKYDLSSATSGSPDLRKAVYWNPNVSVGMKNKTEISYFNSDYVGTYKVVMEVINAEGQIGRVVYRYEVR